MDERDQVADLDPLAPTVQRRGPEVIPAHVQDGQHRRAVGELRVPDEGAEEVEGEEELYGVGEDTAQWSCEKGDWHDGSLLHKLITTHVKLGMRLTGWFCERLFASRVFGVIELA